MVPRGTVRSGPTRGRWCTFLRHPPIAGTTIRTVRAASSVWPIQRARQAWGPVGRSVSSHPRSISEWQGCVKAREAAEAVCHSRPWALGAPLRRARTRGPSCRWANPSRRRGAARPSGGLAPSSDGKGAVVRRGTTPGRSHHTKAAQFPAPSRRRHYDSHCPTASSVWPTQRA